jgi:hypothetical protein
VLQEYCKACDTLIEADDGDILSYLLYSSKRQNKGWICWVLRRPSAFKPTTVLKIDPGGYFCLGNPIVEWLVIVVEHLCKGFTPVLIDRQ